MSLFSDFEDWWKHYPRKVAKGAARKAYERALKKADHQTLVNGVKAYASAIAGKDIEFIAHPATWLNAERWADETKGSNDRLMADRADPDGALKAFAKWIAQGRYMASVSDYRVRTMIAKGYVTPDQARNAGYLV